MDKPYSVDVLKLIDFTQNALVQALTMQELYQDGLTPEKFDEVHAKYENLMSERFRLLRASVENPEAFSKAVAEFRKLDPSNRPN